MKIIRALVYEGSPEALRKIMQFNNIKGKHRLPSGVVIEEYFSKEYPPPDPIDNIEASNFLSAVEIHIEHMEADSREEES